MIIKRVTLITESVTLNLVKKCGRSQIHMGVRFPCDQCDYVGTENRLLKQHKERKHEGRVANIFTILKTFLAFFYLRHKCLFECSLTRVSDNRLEDDLNTLTNKVMKLWSN